MSDTSVSRLGFLSLEVGIGVWWFVWGAKGFWWGVLYGLGWEIWVGYRLAEFFMKR
jgi:hypothetical protein